MNDNNYNPNEIESKWYKKWECSGVFDSIPNKQKAFTITMPPPNVTGVLHMGHILNNTIQDAFIRYARMKNYNACWLPGMDHASIATENKVVSALQKKGIEKNDLSTYDIIKKMCNLSLVEYTDELVENSYSFIEYSSEFFITGYINRQNENLLDNIIDRIEYFKGFISKIEEKLKNDSFINKAPESIIKREKQKLEDSKSQLLLLQEKMRTITNE